MTLRISPERMRQIEAVEYGLSGDIGGLPRTTYYTPDGRVIRAIPSIHVNKAGGSRDANLDKGWLLQPPTVLKPFCKACDRWHDTQEQVEACIAKQQEFTKRMEKQTLQEEQDKTSALEKEVAELKTLVKQLLEAKGGQVLQPALDGNGHVAESTETPQESGG